MFFAPRLILVEGLEDIAYIQAYFHLMEKWEAYRRTGCHIVPTNKKSEIAPALAIARKLGIPTLVIFDADSDVTDHEKRERHIKDNIAILKLCGLSAAEPMPKETFWASNAVMWTTNIGAVVEEDIGKQEWQECRAKADKAYGHVGGLRKNTLHVGASLTFAWEGGLRAPSLERLCSEILAFGGVTPAIRPGS